VFSLRNGLICIFFRRASPSKGWSLDLEDCLETEFSECTKKIRTHLDVALNFVVPDFIVEEVT
jgi:hypothetical protein